MSQTPTKKQKLESELNSELETIYAVELLEYHDKNRLSGDDCSRSKERQRQIRKCMTLSKEIALEK